MSNKYKSLVFIDGNQIKIIFGNSIKVEKLSDINSNENLTFLDKIFKTYEVFVVNQTSKISKDDFLSIITKKNNTETLSENNKTEENAIGNNNEENDTSKFKEVIQNNNYQSPTFMSYIKSNQRSCIVIDDLFTKDTIPGTNIRKALVVPIDRAVCLSHLDPNDVSKSSILKTLLKNNFLSIISKEEAMLLNNKYEENIKKQDEENDDRLESACPVLNSREDVYNQQQSSAKTEVNSKSIDKIANSIPIDVVESTISTDDEADSRINSMSELMYSINEVKLQQGKEGVEEVEVEEITEENNDSKKMEIPMIDRPRINSGTKINKISRK